MIRHDRNPLPDEDAQRSAVPTELYSARFEISEAYGFDRERPLIRHDPSNVLKINGRYHVWYTRYPDRDSWEEVWRVPNYTKIWLAVSDDGWHWTEVGSVLPPSPAGSWHEAGKHAPHILVVDGTYYLFFTAHIGPGYLSKRIGLAVAEGPEGPFRPWGAGPLLPADMGSAVFDVVGQDDSCVLRRDDGFWWYFKGYGYDQTTQRPINNHLCLAHADRPEGPYHRWEGNPVTMSHTACLWPHGDGVAMISDVVHPGAVGHRYPACIQYSEDGLRFHKTVEIQATTQDEGLREAVELSIAHWGVLVVDPGVYVPPDGVRGVSWGLSQLPARSRIREGKSPTHSPFLVRFDCHLRAP